MGLIELMNKFGAQVIVFHILEWLKRFGFVIIMLEHWFGNQVEV